MNELKNSIKYGLIWIIIGILIWMIMTWLMLVIATPRFGESLLPIEVYKFSSLGIKIISIPTTYFGILCIFTLLIIIYSFFKKINNNFKFNIMLKNKLSFLKILIGIIIILILTILLTYFRILYSAIRGVISYPYLCNILIAGILYGFVVWFIFSKYGWLSNFNKLLFEDKAHFFQSIKIGILGSITGFFISLFVFGVMRAINDLFEFSWGAFPTDTLKTNTIIFSVILLAIIISSFLSGLIIHSFSKLGNIKEYLPTLSLFIILLIIFGAVTLYIYYNIFIAKYDYKKDLSKLTGISTEASEIRTVIVFKEKEPIIVRNKNLCRPLLSFNNSLNCELKNIKKIKEYIKKKNNKTYYLNDAYWYIAQCYMMNWELEKADEWCYKSTYERKMLLQTLILLAYLPERKVTNNYITLTNKLYDKQKFYIGSRGYENLIKAFWRFGKIEKAKQLYKEAEKDDKINDGLINFWQNKKIYFNDGKIIGKIFINDKPIRNIKVGVISTDRETPMYTFWFLTATTKTDNNGYFELTNLVDDKSYYLIIMADNSIIPTDKTKLRFVNTPGKINFSKDKPVVNINRINITVHKIRK